MTNFKPLPMATYSKKHHWHNQVDPMFDLYKILAKEIQVEIDNEIIEACINGGGLTMENINSVKDGTK